MKKLFLTLLISIVFIMITDAQSDSTTLLNNGDMAPSFKCKTIEGKTIDISTLRGKVIMVPPVQS
jgi:hypothetical protein